MILDTNVVSEAMKGDPSGIIRRLLQRHPARTWALAAVTVQEITYGLARMPEGSRRSTLTSLWNEVHEVLAVRVYPVDSITAVLAGEILAVRESRGHTIGAPDAQIAATCLQRSEPLATRNLHDFEGLGIDLIDPWAA